MSNTKRAISVTLDADNITWLKGRAGATGVRSVSELLDQIVRAARKLGGGGPSTSVIGTVGATVIAIFFIPMFFWGLETLSDRTSGKKAAEPHVAPQLPGAAGSQEPVHAD